MKSTIAFAAYLSFEPFQKLIVHIVFVPEISNEDQEKIEQFMQTNQKSRQKGHQSRGPVVRGPFRQPVSSLLRNTFRQQHHPMMRGPPYMNVGQHHSQQQRLFAPPTNERIQMVGDGLFRVPRPDGVKKQKILINPHFRGSSAFTQPSMVQGTSSRPSHQFRNLMSHGVARHSDQQQFQVSIDLLS